MRRARASERMKKEGRTRMHGIMVSKSKEERYVDGGGGTDYGHQHPAVNSLECSSGGERTPSSWPCAVSRQRPQQVEQPLVL